MKPGEEDDAWRQIVENYGATPTVDEVAAEVAPAEIVEPLDDEPFDDVPHDDDRRPPGPTLTAWEDEGRFVPPTPPPIPLAEPRRLAAWVGLFGVPVLFLLSVLVSLAFPGWLKLGLIAWFVGGFCFLVATMPRQRNDPWDDGSRI